MACYVCPPKSEFGRLRPPLTDGEMQVFEFFDANLAEKWEIYIRPHMNGLEPDFVLLNPKVGLAVFEVKDWPLTNPNFPYRIEFDKKGDPRLMAGKSAQRGARPRQLPDGRVLASRTPRLRQILARQRILHLRGLILDAH